MNSYELGQWGEECAVQYLLSKKYRIVKRNFRIREGEIDIIVSRDRILVFIEVKTRSSDSFILPCESVTWKKQKTIRRVAASYLQHHFLPYDEIRFDVIEVYADKKQIRHLENAF